MTGAYVIRVDGGREVAKYDFQTGYIRCPICGELVPIGIDNKESESYIKFTPVLSQVPVFLISTNKKPNP